MSSCAKNRAEGRLRSFGAGIGEEYTFYFADDIMRIEMPRAIPLGYLKVIFGRG